MTTSTSPETISADDDEEIRDIPDTRKANDPRIGRLKKAQHLLYRLALDHEDPAVLRMQAAIYLADTMTPFEIREAFGDQHQHRERISPGQRAA
jgi:hypothetical protein